MACDRSHSHLETVIRLCAFARSPARRSLQLDRFVWAKECYEHLGFVYASGVAGGPTVGEVRPEDRPRKLAQLFVKSVEASDIEDEYGIHFQDSYGVSANTRSSWPRGRG